MSLGATITVLIAYNIVLTEIFARLHLDDLERNLAWVFQAMGLAEGDVGALVFSEQKGFTALSNLGRALDDDPVLGAVVVALQGEAAARLDSDALDLKAIPDIDNVK